MKRLTIGDWRLAIWVLLALLVGGEASGQVITMSVTVTNRAVTSNSFTANGSVRVFTNSTGPLLVATNLSHQYSTKTNLFNAIAAFPFTGVTLQDGVGAAAQSNFTLRAALGGALSGSITGNWGYVTLATQSGPSTFTMLYPVANIVGETNRTNQASDVVSALNTFPTNALATNAASLSNFLTKGASPVQAIASPVQFNGRVGIGGSLNATNGFDSGRTNINPVTSNLVNYGNAIRSHGPGGNSLQLGSNALALGSRSLAIGNNSLATNDDAVAIGTSAVATNSVAIGTATEAQGLLSTAIGNGALARGQQGLSVGYASLSTGDNGAAIGTGAISRDNGQAFGLNSEARSNNAVAVGLSAFASGVNTMAIGTSSSATHSNSAAVGPLDDSGTAVATTDTNQVRLGTSRHRISAPGIYESPKGTNSQFAGTNIARGSWSYPALALSSLAAGNNISVPFATNKYIRCNSGPASAATICGIIGGATSGGLDGQEIEVLNDTGFSLTFAVNTVDPVARNRINTPLGSDISIPDQGTAWLRYDGTDERWKLTGTFPIQASATNALASVFTNGVLVSGSVTSLNVITGPGTTILTTNVFGRVDMQFLATIPNGEVAITNATRIGLVHDQLTGTNRLRSLQGGDLITLTNEGTNVVIAGAAAYTVLLATAGANNLADSTTYFYGADLNATLNTTWDNTSVDIPKAGTLKRVFVKVRIAGTLATTEAVSHYIRLNDTTDITINTTATYNLALTNLVATGLSQALAVGDRVNLKVVTPAWVTNPTTVRYYCLLWIE